MERLTERWGEDDVWVKEHDYVSAEHCHADYEDTGLEPDEVAALQKDWSDLRTMIGECGGVDRLLRTETSAGGAVGGGCGRRAAGGHGNVHTL